MAIFAAASLAVGCAGPGPGGATGSGPAAESGDFWNFRVPGFLPRALRWKLAERKAGALVGEMSRDEIIAQTLLVGYPGTEPSAEFLGRIRKLGLGGIKIFGWNAESTEPLARSTGMLQEAALSSTQGIPLLIATDQEGGWIRHVKGKTSESPGNMAIGATRSVSDARNAGYYLGVELARLGIRMNLGPVVDLATDPDSSIIGPRAFSDDPVLAARLGEAWFKGSLAAGVIPAAKHYPGHGATAIDSHGATPLISVGKATFRNRELYPFGTLVRAGVPALMSGHLAFPAVTGDDTPASLSATLIGDYLRGRLGFDGVVLTDDLYMEGALGEGTALETCVRALEAGNDLLMLSVAPDPRGALWKGLAARFDANPAFASRVRQAATRVVALKLLYLRPLGKEGLTGAAETAGGPLPDPEGAAFFADLARRSATSWGPQGGIPFKPSGRLILAGPFDTFISAGKAAYPRADGFQFSYRPEAAPLPDEFASFTARLSSYDAAIVCVANQSGLSYALAAKDAGLEVAVVSVLSPSRARGAASWARAVVSVYHYAKPSLQAAFDVLTGRLHARGRLPISKEKVR